ncbi:hypothetical protein [Marinivivus vitaminiproducens]|uniref:hypothetical protein n=1 Tax=Marinivivus vitaminiproducens TaxID=3035935 RepID=UPI0027AAAF1E|nr:hypothetical protein P4R82_08115 [Geminicoccaceae bacterium SCSIO 64248]
MNARLDEMMFGQAAAAALAGLSVPQLNNWLHRDRLFYGERPGRGQAWSFSFSNVFTLAGIRAFVEDTGLASTIAVRALGSHSLLGAFFEGSSFVLSLTDDGHWAAVGNLRRVEMHINPEKIWIEMRERCLAHLPAETMAFEAEVAEIRRRQNPSADTFHAIAEKAYSSRGQTGE